MAKKKSADLFDEAPVAKAKKSAAKPKKAAEKGYSAADIEVLEGLEPVRRGFYAGALGWLDLRGGCELSVVIRTAFLASGRAWVHTGGGIVADSEPQAEWRETEDKAAPLLEALGRVARD